MTMRATTEATIRTHLAIATATVIVLVGQAGSLFAQSSIDQAVIYEECLRPPERTLWGRFAECGVEEAATAQLQATIGESRRPLTPTETREVDEYLDRQFAAPALAARRAEFLAIIDWTIRRIERVLTNDTYRFTTADRSALSQWSKMLHVARSESKNEAIARDDFNALSAQVHDVVLSVAAIVASAPRALTTETPRIESLVTRIDALVARVGTALRDLEREGLIVPRVVRDGHARALELVRDSKRNCSTRRPEACANLGEVLATIEAMREPLCNLPSDQLTFCD